MIRKVIEIGNSLAVTIPKETVESKGLRKGDYLGLTFSKVFVKKEDEDGEKNTT